MRSPTRPRDTSFLKEQEKDAATQSFAKEQGERYYARAKWWFDIERYHAAAWLCRAGLRLSMDPFMLAVRDQLHELAVSCDRHLEAAGLKYARHLCSIDITVRGTQASRRYLAKLTIDELVELELRLVECATVGNVESFSVKPRDPVENLNYLIQCMNCDLLRVA